MDKVEVQNVMDVLCNIFSMRIKSLTDYGSYMLSANPWNLEFSLNYYSNTLVIFNLSGYANAVCHIENSDDTEDEIKGKLISFIGSVLKDMCDNSDILSWPINCNMSYVGKLKDVMSKNYGITSGCHSKSKKLKKGKSVKSSVDTSDGSFFSAQVPDSAYLQDGYLQFEGNDVWIVFQKRDKEGDIISEKEITENDLVPVDSLQSSAIESTVLKQGLSREEIIEKINDIEPDDYSDWTTEELQELALNLGLVISSRKSIKSSDVSFSYEDAVQAAFPDVSSNTIDIIAEWYRNEGARDDFDDVDEFAEHIENDFMDMFWAGDYNNDEFHEVATDMIDAGYYDADDFPYGEDEDEDEDDWVISSRKSIKSSHIPFSHIEDGMVGQDQEGNDVLILDYGPASKFRRYSGFDELAEIAVDIYGEDEENIDDCFPECVLVKHSNGDKAVYAYGGDGVTVSYAENNLASRN